MAAAATTATITTSDPCGVLPDCPFFATARQAYEPAATAQAELALDAGERVVVLRHADRGWVLVKKEQQQQKDAGYVPREWLCPQPGTPDVRLVGDEEEEQHKHQEKDEDEAAAGTAAAAAAAEGVEEKDAKSPTITREDVDVTPFQYKEADEPANMPVIGW